jgi:hypothetical protein
MGLDTATADRLLFMAVLTAHFGEHRGVLGAQVIFHEGGDAPAELARWARHQIEELDLDDLDIPEGVAVCVIGWEHHPPFYDNYDDYVEEPELNATRPAPAPGEPWWLGTKEAVAEFRAAADLSLAWWEANALEDDSERFGLSPEDALRYYKARAEYEEGHARLAALMTA